jgi:hypothetical protein
MQPTKWLAIAMLAAALAMLFLEGCASGDGGNLRMTEQAALRCPAGYTVTCEARKIGRIHHGSFGKNYDSCACVSNSSHGDTTPVIPRL